jgi:CubicO group peptidase (beta-lactamase class C family)
LQFLLAATLALSHAQRSAIDGIVERVMHDDRIAGLSVGIACAGGPLYLHGYGLRDVGRTLRADPYTLYRIGSVTKQFVAALTLQGAEAGTIALETPLRQYVPSASPAVGRVTVEQLLDQTSGIGVDGIATAEPGTGWSYSNANYALLDAILERTTGRALPALLRERIVEPLGLRSTGYGFVPQAANVARGYAWADGWNEVTPTADRSRIAGTMVSNVPDLLRWLEALRAGRVVSARSLAAMTASGRLLDGTPTHYGFGFFVADWFGYRAVEHPGFVDGFSALDVLLLDDGLSVAILANADAVDLVPLAKSLVAIVDRPRDPNLLAQISRPPENENLQITSDLKAILQTPGFARLGRLVAVEFVERSVVEGATHDKYRVTFSGGTWWVTIAYRENGPIEALTLSPIE